ncbi:hypothetical protein JZU56_04425, partial [bacterium]|nr:hypothetical protein [bacterium]
MQSINDIAASKTVTDHILGFETGRIITDMADFYNVSADALQAIVVRMKAERAGLADSIKNRMFFASSDTEL